LEVSVAICVSFSPLFRWRQWTRRLCKFEAKSQEVCAAEMTGTAPRYTLIYQLRIQDFYYVAALPFQCTASASSSSSTVGICHLFGRIG
jgi:hypothetical protein